jgi:hypothetical protein
LPFFVNKDSRTVLFENPLQNIVDDGPTKPSKPTIRPPRPSTPKPKPQRTTTTTEPSYEYEDSEQPPTGAEEPEEATLPPFVDEETLTLARSFGFDIVPGDQEPPTQEEVDQVLELLPPGVSFSLLPMNMQDSFFAGEIKIKKLDEKRKRRSQQEMALKIKKQTAANHRS